MRDNKKGRIKIKKNLSQFKNIQVKKNGRVNRKLAARHKHIFPASRTRWEY